MSEKSTDESGRIRVLISGHLPPPIGGMATYYKILVNSSLSDYVDYRFVQTSSQKRELSSSGRATFSNLIAAIRDCIRFTQALLVYRPQITHIGTAFGLSFLKHSYCVLIAHLLGKRVLLHPHCSLSALYFNQSAEWQWFFRQVIHWTDGIVVLSQEWMQLSSIVPGCKIFYLPNPVDIMEYQNALLQHQSEIKKVGPLSILYLGYLGRAKGSFDIIDAAYIIRERGIEMIFDLVGSELTPGEIKLLHEKVGLFNLERYIRFHLQVDGIDKLNFFRDADIFIYPSYHEGIPMAVLEAMASGLPVVASRVGGLPDLILDGINGILIEAGQPSQLADALCNLVKNHSQRFSMQKNSYRIVCDKFGIEQHLAQLVGIYKLAISNLPVR